jgi:hypothetical protein
LSNTFSKLRNLYLLGFAKCGELINVNFRLCDGSGVAVRKDRLVRLVELQRRFGRTNKFPAQSLLVCPHQSETARKSLRLLGASSTFIAIFHLDGSFVSVEKIPPAPGKNPVVD